ncbi:RCC1 domain-containing protein, partial [Vibrio penaeicida]|uniref:hypothetical protein n=1 Tax=Vibrio penaeicida TaxID=104609 RepID=UPI00163CD2FA
EPEPGPELSLSEISEISISGDMVPDSTIIPTISCTECAGTTFYRWLIDDVEVSTSPQYLFTLSDFEKTLTLEVKVTDSNGTISDTSFAKFKRTHVNSITTNPFAYAALMNDKSVVTWGITNNGGNSISVASQLTDIDSIVAGYSSFAAIKTDGSVVTWGLASSGGDSSSVKDDLINVTAITSNNHAFAALKSDGTVVTWGNSSRGGDSSAVQLNLTNVIEIVSTEFAFAARKSDGTVVVWGDPLRGGDLEGLSLSNIDRVIGGKYAFAAVDQSNTVYFWGLDAAGGLPISAIPNYAASGVSTVISNDLSFAMIKTNNELTAHGFNNYGGDMGTLANRVTNTSSVYGSRYGFAALLEDGSVVGWGSIDGVLYGTATKPNFYTPTVTSISTITITRDAFAALETNGTVVTWGDADDGGDSTSVAAELVNVSSIHSARSAFVALKEDGSVVTWGDTSRGGDSSLNLTGTLEDIESIYSSLYAFSVITEQKDIVTWGLLSHSDISSVMSSLEPKVERIETSYD